MGAVLGLQYQSGHLGFWHNPLGDLLWRSVGQAVRADIGSPQTGTSGGCRYLRAVSFYQTRGQAHCGSYHGKAHRDRDRCPLMQSERQVIQVAL